MLTPFGPEIWLADGPVVTGAAGFRFPTRMVVIRLADGGLFVWSPVALTAPLSSAVSALGPVSHLVAPNDLHHLALGDWAQAFPSARAHGAPGLAAKRPDLRLDTTLGPSPDDAWAGQVDQVVFAGNRITTEVVFFHRASGTAIFTDLLQQMPPGWYSGWRGLVARLDLMIGDAPQVPRKFRLAFSDRAAARGARDAVLDWPVDRLVIAHGPTAAAGHEAIRRAFAWL